MITYEEIIPFTIVIKDNVIEVLYNSETFINEYVNKYMLNKIIKGMLLVKIIYIYYSNPKVLNNVISNKDRYKIKAEGKFLCVKYFQETLINHLVLDKDNKIENISIYTKNLQNNIKLTCIDKQNNIYSTNEFAQIKKINYINNDNINMIIEKYNPNEIKNFYFNSNISNYQFIDVINKNIDKNFKFNFNNKLIDYQSIIKFLFSLKKDVNFVAKINSKSIIIVKEEQFIVPKKSNEGYFYLLLIQLFNYFIVNNRSGFLKLD